MDGCLLDQVGGGGIAPRRRRIDTRVALMFGRCWTPPAKPPSPRVHAIGRPKCRHPVDGPLTPPEIDH